MTSLEIEGSNIGRLIGTRGATIKKLQSDFNVTISISKEDNDVNTIHCFAIHFNLMFQYFPEWLQSCRHLWLRSGCGHCL